MKDMKTVASYIYHRYQAEHGEKIDEMKLHKLMYFAQRESLIRTNEPLFEAEFQGWRFGPVIPDLRPIYKSDDFPMVADEEIGADKVALDYIFKEYAHKEPWSLSRLSCGEICWKISRKGIDSAAVSKNVIPLDDIRLDAVRMEIRRHMLHQHGLLDDLFDESNIEPDPETQSNDELKLFALRLDVDDGYNRFETVVRCLSYTEKSARRAVLMSFHRYEVVTIKSITEVEMHEGMVF